MSDTLYYILLNDQKAGPYTIGQLRAMWQSGAITAQTQYWFDGASDWRPLINLRSMSSSSSSAITSGAIGVAILCFLVWKLTAIERLLDKKVTPPEFEYMVAAPKDYAFDSQMNALGKQGWELVSARRATSSSEYDKTASYEVILKRQIR